MLETKILPTCITELFSKCENLKENEYLLTSFGAEDTYMIGKEDNKYILRQKHNMFTSKWCDQFYFDNPGSLHGNLLSDPYNDFYAKNVFSGKIQHMDNIANFCNSFKVTIQK